MADSRHACDSLSSQYLRRHTAGRAWPGGGGRGLARVGDRAWQTGGQSPALVELPAGPGAIGERHPHQQLEPRKAMRRSARHDRAWRCRSGRPPKRLGGLGVSHATGRALPGGCRGVDRTEVMTFGAEGGHGVKSGRGRSDGFRYVHVGRSQVRPEELILSFLLPPPVAVASPNLTNGGDIENSIQPNTTKSSR